MDQTIKVKVDGKVYSRPWVPKRKPTAAEILRMQEQIRKENRYRATKEPYSWFTDAGTRSKALDRLLRPAQSFQFGKPEKTSLQSYMDSLVKQAQTAKRKPKPQPKDDFSKVANRPALEIAMRGIDRDLERKYRDPKQRAEARARRKAELSVKLAPLGKVSKSFSRLDDRNLASLLTTRRASQEYAKRGALLLKLARETKDPLIALKAREFFRRVENKNAISGNTRKLMDELDEAEELKRMSPAEWAVSAIEAPITTLDSALVGMTPKEFRKHGSEWGKLAAGGADLVAQIALENVLGSVLAPTHAVTTGGKIAKGLRRVIGKVKPVAGLTVKDRLKRAAITELAKGSFNDIAVKGADFAATAQSDGLKKAALDAIPFKGAFDPEATWSERVLSVAGDAKMLKDGYLYAKGIKRGGHFRAGDDATIRDSVKAGYKQFMREVRDANRLPERTKLLPDKPIMDISDHPNYVPGMDLHYKHNKYFVMKDGIVVSQRSPDLNEAMDSIMTTYGKAYREAYKQSKKKNKK